MLSGKQIKLFTSWRD